MNIPLQPETPARNEAPFAPVRTWRVWLWSFGPFALIGLFFTSQTYLQMEMRGLEAFWGSLRGTMVYWLGWWMLSPAIVWLDRRLVSRDAPIRARVTTHLRLAVYFSVLFVTLRMLLDTVLLGMQVHPWERLIGLHSSALIYGFIAGLYVAWDYYRQARDRQLRTARLEARLADARLEALRSQINPHFLFNALNTISSLVEQDPRCARRMTANLGDLLRSAVQHQDGAECTVRQELELTGKYMEIQRARFGSRLQYEVDAAPGTEGARVPTLLLQPLVENAVEHGVRGRAGTGRIRIQIARANGELAIDVLDDGIGLPPGWSMDDSVGIGLGNTRARLRELYGSSASLELSRLDQGGTAARVRIPFRGGGEEETG